METINNSTNKIIIGSQNSNETNNITAKNFKINAASLSEQNGYLKTASIALGSGAFSEIQNTSNSAIDINIFGKTNILANNFEIRGLNQFEKNNNGRKNIDSLSVSGLDLFKTSSVTNINNNVNINFGNDTNIKTYRGDDEKGSSIFIVDAANIVNAEDKAKFKSASGLAGTSITSQINNNANQNINFNGKIVTARDMTVNAHAGHNINTNIEANASGGAIYIDGRTLTASNIRNTANINRAYGFQCRSFVHI